MGPPPMRLLRLRGRKVCDALLRKGLTWKGKTLAVRWLPSPPRHPSTDPSAVALYVGSFASTKLDKSAVRRNRMRRRCREALRVLSKERADLPAAQLLLCPRSSSLDAPFSAIEADVTAFLQILAACQKSPPPSPPSRASLTSR